MVFRLHRKHLASAWDYILHAQSSRSLAGGYVWSPVATGEQRWLCACRRFEKTWKRRRVNLSKRLLLVDDEPSLLRAVAACLRGEGYEVDTARSGDEALVHIAQRLPDLIVLSLIH